jgi:hypothetical protein
MCSNPMRLGVPRALEGTASQVEHLVHSLGGDRPIHR